MVFKLAQWGADPISLFFLTVFLPCSLFIYYVIPSIYRREVIVSLSLAYLFFVSPWQIPLIFICLISSYLLLLQLGEISQDVVYPRRILLGICIGINILFWLVFGMGLWHRGIPYVVGGSVFPLLAIDTAVYFYKNPKEPLPPLLHFLAYCLFFPRLYLGPVESYGEFWKTGISRKGAGKNLWMGTKKLIRGVFLFEFLGIRLLQLAQQIGEFYQGDITTLSTWSMVLLNALGFYYVLWGFSSLAVGMGEMFFIPLPVDVTNPLEKETLRDTLLSFHKTVAQFFERNLYTPLTHRIKTPLWNVFSGTLTGGIFGLWFGFSWGMFLWGAVLGGGIVLQEGYNKNKKVKAVVNKTGTRILLILSFLLLILGNNRENITLFQSILPRKGVELANNPILFLLMSHWVVLGMGILLVIPQVDSFPDFLAEVFPQWMKAPLEIGIHLFLGAIVLILMI